MHHTLISVQLRCPGGLAAHYARCLCRCLGTKMQGCSREIASLFDIRSQVHVQKAYRNNMGIYMYGRDDVNKYICCHLACAFRCSQCSNRVIWTMMSSSSKLSPRVSGTHCKAVDVHLPNDGRDFFAEQPTSE
jgi:hypothetical protein